jgi:transposase
MSNRHHALADKVVAAFRDRLEAAEQGRIGEARFRELHEIVCEALSEELDATTERIAALLKELRAEVEKRELEL